MAQNPPPVDEIRPTVAGPQRGDRRPNLLQELGLSAEQVQQIRQINRERRPESDAALKRLGDANRRLDEAIYADSVDENEVGIRLKEVQDAQAELASIRFMNELAIRNVLSPDQLVRFRDMRRQFAEARERFRESRQGPGSNKRFRRMNRFSKPISQ
jgi:Spy/CpxP family protein refolding chaperone